MPLLTTDDLIAALTIHPNWVGWKGAGTTSGALAMFTNRFFYSGSWGAADTTSPGVAGAVPTKTSDGAIQFPEAATPGNNLFLGAIGAMKTVNAGQIILVDRLWHGRGYSLTTTGTQTVNSVALTRPDNLGEDTELWIEFGGTIGATAGALTVTYTNQDGTSGRTATWTHVASQLAGTHQCDRMTLQPNDTGIRSIQSLSWNTAPGSGSVSQFGLAIVRRLATMHCAIGGRYYHIGPYDTGVPTIYDTSCLSVYTGNSATSVGEVWLSLKLGETS